MKKKSVHLNKYMNLRVTCVHVFYTGEFNKV